MTVHILNCILAISHTVSGKTTRMFWILFLFLPSPHHIVSGKTFKFLAILPVSELWFFGEKQLGIFLYSHFIKIPLLWFLLQTSKRKSRQCLFKKKLALSSQSPGCISKPHPYSYRLEPLLLNPLFSNAFKSWIRVRNMEYKFGICIFTFSKKRLACLLWLLKVAGGPPVANFANPLWCVPVKWVNCISSSIHQQSCNMSNLYTNSSATFILD